MVNLSKNIVLKIAILLVSVITVISLTFTATYSRYITTVDKDIGFKATKQPKILFGETEVKPNTLIPLTNWVEGVEQLNGSFNLTASGLAENEDMNFYIRVFAEKIDPADAVPDESDTTNDPLKDVLSGYEDETQGKKLPIEMTLSLGNAVYTALENETNTESDFYNKNQKINMELTSLTAISPIDGRYRGKCENLDEYVSFFPLLKIKIVFISKNTRFIIT